MTVLSINFLSIFLLLALSGYASSKQTKLSEFGEKALAGLPKDKFNKLFGLNYKNADEFAKTIEGSADVFSKVYGAPFPDRFRKEIIKIVKNVSVPITPKLLFTVFANGISRTLEKNGKLTKDNVGKLAKSYASILEKAADSLKSDAFSETEPAVVGAVAKFLKSLGMPTEEKLVEFQENLLDEGRKDLN